MRNSRRYNVLGVDTGHRLVLTSLWRKNDFERCKSVNKPTIKEENNHVMIDLKMKKKKMKEKMSQTKNPDKIKKLKKERTRANNCPKRRIGFLVTRAMLKESNDIMQAKDDAQSSLAIKNIIRKKTRKKPQIKIEEHTNYFKDQLQFTICQVEVTSSSFWKSVSTSERERTRTKLRNNRATGPDSIRGEDLKRESVEKLTRDLNILILNSDESLTKGYLVPIQKPGKDSTKPESHRPVILLSAYRKLLSLIILERIKDQIEGSLSQTQFAYRTNRSTGDIVLSHKYMMTGAISKGFDKYCVGNDMSKAFDNVDRNKLIDILRSRKTPEENITLIKKVLTNAALEVKAGKKLGEKFPTNKGVLQGTVSHPAYLQSI